MKCVSKERIIPFQDRPVFTGFVTYINHEKPVLMHRYGYVDASDTYDDFGDTISVDNGDTWSPWRMRQTSVPVDGGRMRWIENACFFDAQRDTLWNFVSKRVYTENETPRTRTAFLVEINRYDPAADQWVFLKDTNLGLANLMVSFCRPMRTASGRLLVPAATYAVNDRGEPRMHPVSNSLELQALVMIGEPGPDGTLSWRASDRVCGDPDKTSRGLCEPMILQLGDGRIAMILRGSNMGMEHAVGCKWVSFSVDDGQTWSRPEPLHYADGGVVESGATGGALFRSETDGRAFWIGNPAIDAPASGNWPRHLLAMFEVQEEPFALRRETMAVIERGDTEKTPKVQYSNFRFYQDRLTGDVVLYMSDFGARGENWKRADYWRYRIIL